MRKVFIDSDVILDLLLERDPFVIEAEKIFKKIELKKIEGYTSPVILSNVYYICSNLKDKNVGLKNIRKICKLLKIALINQKIVNTTLSNNKIKDFEDELQLYSVIEMGLDFLLTRNITDFPNTDRIKIIKPEEFITFIESEEKMP